MSSNLLWRPLEPPSGRDLPYALKSVLRKRYGEPVNTDLCTDDLPYLNGLADAEIEGAQALIDAIEKCERIFVWEQYL